MTRGKVRVVSVSRSLLAAANSKLLLEEALKVFTSLVTSGQANQQVALSPVTAQLLDKNPGPKFAHVARLVLRSIEDGTFQPGQPIPSAAALSRLTGYSTGTCKKGLRLLARGGVLRSGLTEQSRLRVTGPAPAPGADDSTEAAHRLSAELASRRRGAHLTQPELAALVGKSVTTVGHAETGRVWQSRAFRERADTVLAAGGTLLELHRAYQAASTQRDFGTPCLRPAKAAPVAALPQAQPTGEPTTSTAARLPFPVSVIVVWSDGTTVTYPAGQALQSDPKK